MIHLIGIGYKPLDDNAERALLQSECIVASTRLEEVFRRYSQYSKVSDKVKVIDKLEETLSFVSANGDKTIALLASGDALFHGIARRVLAQCGNDNVTIHPELSCLQVAFSRIKEPWDDALLISLHGGLLNTRHKGYVLEDLTKLVKRHHKIAILTDPKNDPVAIASALLDYPSSEAIKIYVCERLGYPEEQVTEGTPKEIAKGQYRQPNVVIILREALLDKKSPQLKAGFGITEGELAHREGLITKDEVRAAILHKLRLPKEGILWDIGAGSGSVSIEAANMFDGLRVYAVEKDPVQCSLIRENLSYHNLDNVTVIEGPAPEALMELPSPDRVFIGGSSGEMEKILDAIIAKSEFSPHIVLSATMIETLYRSIDAFRKRGFELECSQIAVSRLTPISTGGYFKALNPVYVVTAKK